MEDSETLEAYVRHETTRVRSHGGSDIPLERGFPAGENKPEF